VTALLQALQPFFAPVFTLWGTAVSALEIVAFVLAIVMVVLNMRVNALAWPLAIVSSLLYFALFWNSKLYGDASLQVVYIALGFQGWRYWLHGGQNREAAQITHASPQSLITLGGFVIFGTAGLVLALRAAGGACGCRSRCR